MNNCKTYPVNTKDRKILRNLIAFGTSYLCVLSPVFSQDAEGEGKEVFELSPFVVSGADSGYYASETLSGTSLRTNIRTLANPITVFTGEVMEDIGATSYKDVVQFMPSSSTYDGDIADPLGEQVRAGTPFVSRGFRVTQLTQNFLATNVRQDNYNTERLTQSRGPNSLLFGLGSVGGAIEIQPKRAMFGKDFAQVNLLLDDNERVRGKFDFNKTLVDDKIAVRLAALYDDNRTFRDIEYSERKSVYGDITFKPFNKTTIRVNAEFGSIDENLPRLFVTKDRITPWTSSPLSLLDKANTTDLDLIVNGPGNLRTEATNIIRGVTQRFRTNNYLVWIANDPSLGVLNWRFKGRGSDFDINGTLRGNVSLKESQLTDDVNFPLTTVIAGPSDLVSWDYEKYSITLEQQIGSDTFLQVVAGKENQDRYDYRPVRRQNWSIQIDNNYYLPTQRASDNPDPTQPLNPYFGVPYIESNPYLITAETELEQLRASLTHRIDLTGIEIADGWDLGEIQLVGSWYHLKSGDNLTQKEEMTLQSVLPNGVVSNLQNQIYRRFYISSSTPNYPNIPWSPLSQPGDSSIGGRIVPAIESAFVNRLPPILNESTTESIYGVIQWKPFNERLSLTAGYREDEYQGSAITIPIDPVTRLYGDLDTGELDRSSKSKVSNYNLGAVFRPFRDFDFFINKATNNVNASTSRFDIFGNFLPPEEGEGMDYGIRAFLLEDRVIVKVNYYENTQFNVLSNPLRDGAGIGIGLARELGRVERLLNSVSAAGRSDLVEGAIRYGDFPGNQLWTDIQNIRSEGYELEVTANITDRWNILFNISIQDSFLDDTYLIFDEWYDRYFVPIKNTADIQSAPDPSGGGFDVARLVNDIDVKYAFHESQVGGQLERSSRLAWNLISTYKFDQDFFAKNLRVGTAVRWREGPALGYPEPEPGVFDTSNPFKGDDDLTVDVWFAKPFRLSKGPNSKVLNVTLRVKNVFDDGPLFSRSGTDDGAGNVVILAETFKRPRSFQLEIGMRF
ncbi:hypothetical protein G0Q06_03915 [Puniceicoccales bacterium CK1056]|uniref:TonB-dependent receptor plug domain-containing protein n=1 Tax=Oceanipulchritudo coccoides TaxID=2706888 RepID=A0A6B2LY85_9BACT|nr:hypothetical protein [Oceanipulchritudo coccoides]NDV61588.1 hypothetical protein [Oceanipulchritudo coccoides]